MKSLHLIAAALAALAAATPGLGQSKLQVSVTTGGAASLLAPGGAVALTASGIGQPALATFGVRNTGTAAVSITGVSVSGPPDLTLTLAPAFPVSLNANDSATFSIQYRPTTGNAVTAQIAIGFVEGGQPGTFPIAVSGTATATSFAATYTLADGNVRPLADGARIVFPAIDVNTTSTATIEILNQGAGSGIVNGVTLSGTAFHLTGLPLLPATVGGGQPLRFGIVFAPTQTGSYSGSFRIDLPGRSISGSLAASTAASNISLAYIDPDTNNTIPLREAATLPFPSTAVGASSTVTVVVSNSGAGTAVVDSVALNTAAPSAFQLLNLPAFPASAPPSQQLRFGVRFSPQQQQAFSAALVVSVNGRPTTVNLQAQGSAPQFTYKYGAGSTAAAPGGVLALGDTALGQTTGVAVSVTNAGNAEGQVSTIAVTGAGFSLSDLPALPFTLSAGGSQSFTLNFAPAQPGPANGRLTIGKDTFTLTATGIGSHLTYSYTGTAPAAAVVDGGVVIFPPIEVGKSGNVQFAIQNTGTSAASISSINLTASGTAFALEQLPLLPFSLDAGATAAFVVSFTPGTTGSLSATLRVDNSSFTLSGSGAQPAPLPSYQFQGSGGSAQPAQQPSIGLTLASPYPLALDGVLKLTFVSGAFTDDPAIQFATGGRTLSFTIPANSTRALFNGNPSMALQTGTTTGTIVITPSFAMRSGFDMTPPTPDVLTITIPRAAPQLLSTGITSQTATSFTVTLSGYSTTRALRQLDVQFTPKQGESFSTASLTIDVTAAALAWFQSAASQNAGGSFSAAIPFVLQNGNNTDDLVHRLQSLSITATNEVGVSTAVTIPIP